MGKEVYTQVAAMQHANGESRIYRTVLNKTKAIRKNLTAVLMNAVSLRVNTRYSEFE
jgi:hypothetical protein